MKMFQDAHLEVKKFFSGSFCTNPYEAGWADEAIFFILVEKQLGEPVMTARVQLSQDGVHFTDDGSSPVTISGIGQHFIKVQPNFGNYLRLAIKIEGGEMFLNIHIACKG